ncbi:MAG: FecR domain-containing protein [Bdellovibrionales bacterium]|nr:FecR domain-containing protein [Bdellovibrionales bacterium]
MRRFLSRALLIALAIPAALASASDQVGHLTRVEGVVRILANPSETLQGEGPHAIYESEYFSVRAATVGTPLDNGDVISTAPGGKARIVYENGDHYTVGPSTEFRIRWNGSGAEARPNIRILHGNLRGVVSKGGPRSRLSIRTRSATMGVRGTEFFVADQGASGQTSVAVLRGSVELKSKDVEKAVDVKQGQTASVSAPEPSPAAQQAAAPAAPAQIEVLTTTQEELSTIRVLSNVKAEIKDAVAKDDNRKQVEEKAQALERKAVETTLKDLKTYQPEVAAQLANTKITDPGEIGEKTVAKAIEKAPEAGRDRKPFGLDMDDSSDMYDKYFKNQ